MREITKIMIKNFKIGKLGYDFMGYSFGNKENLNFHHLIVAHRNCKAKNIPAEGYLEWNGAILNCRTSHPYLHIIERYDSDMFYAITSEMIDENIKGKLDIDNIMKIHDILSQFEKEYCGKRTRGTKKLIKEEYIKGRMVNCDNKKFF